MVLFKTNSNFFQRQQRANAPLGRVITLYACGDGVNVRDSSAAYITSTFSTLNVSAHLKSLQLNLRSVQKYFVPLPTFRNLLDRHVL